MTSTQFAKPNKDMPLDEWLSYLETVHQKTIDLGLERVAHVAKKLGLTHIAPFVITVGGTNGKGTTCRLLEIILLKIGLKVGVYSSPHLLHYRERVRINGTMLDDIAHCQSFDFIEKNKHCSLSYFEFSTLSALHLFQQAQLDVVILEVGLGGRLDATNIIDSNIAIITSIDIDHTAFLGESRDKIAFEKAGIFRPNCPVIIGEPVIPIRMQKEAKRLGCQLCCVGEDWQYKECDTSWDWKSSSQLFQNLPKPAIPIANAGTVLATLPFLPFTIKEEQVISALQEVSLTGRFQPLSSELRQKLARKCQLPIAHLPEIILDVGHNPHASCYLARKIQTLKNTSTPRFLGKVFALCGILKDKDLIGILTPMQNVIDEWHCITLTGERGQEGENIAQALATLGACDAKHYPSIDNALGQVLPYLNENDTLIVFGSFHTVADLLLFLQA